MRRRERGRRERERRGAKSYKGKLTNFCGERGNTSENERF